MILTSASQCHLCKHYRKDQKCDAYPEKIPDALWDGDIVHSKPFPGDQGIMLEWKPIKTPRFYVDD